MKIGKYSVSCLPKSAGIDRSWGFTGVHVIGNVWGLSYREGARGGFMMEGSV